MATQPANTPKIVLYINVSLDGYTAGPAGELDWLVPWAGSEEAKQFLHEQMEDMDTVLLGRENYQGYSGFWPHVAKNPESPADIAAYARWLDAVEKVVFSRTLKTVEWNNARLATRSLEAEVSAIKSRPGKSAIILCSTGLGQSFLRAGLVDEVRLNVLPVVLGGGKRLFPDLAARLSLRQTSARALPSGVLALRYACEPSPASR